MVIYARDYHEFDTIVKYAKMLGIHDLRYYTCGYGKAGYGAVFYQGDPDAKVHEMVHAFTRQLCVERSQLPVLS